MSTFSRRDFLKLSSALLGGTALWRALPALNRMSVPKPERPNVLILVFDTMSAPHLSVYGYGRATTPHLERFAGRATVYHSHYAESSFTTPATASMLTGLLPWSHRAINPGGLIRRELALNNLFRAAGDNYYKIGFTQNLWADLFLRQFHADVDWHLPAYSFAYKNPLLLGELTTRDPLPFFAYDDFLVGGVKLDTPYAGSIMLGMLDAAAGRGWNVNPDLRHMQEGEPRPPFNGYFYYQNRMVFQGLQEIIEQAASAESRPWLAYFHLWSPHEPYAPRREFRHLFDADLKIPVRPRHPLADSPFREIELRQYARLYDQYITNVDAEFGMLLDALDVAGLLDNTYVIVTSDHGQLFERGVHGHASRLMYEGVIRVPLLISAPRQMQRLDVYSPTAHVDLLPTLAAVMGVQPPTRLDGRLLPGLGGEADDGRSVYSMRNNENSAFRPFRRGSFVLIKGTRKLIWYADYPGYDDIFELYELKEDPYELRDLSTADPATMKRMKEELLAARQAAERSTAAGAPSE